MFSGSDYAAIAVIAVLILAPMAAGAKKGIDEGITRDTPVTAGAPASTPTPPVTPASATAPKPADTPAPASAPATPAPAGQQK